MFQNIRGKRVKVVIANIVLLLCAYYAADSWASVERRHVFRFHVTSVSANDATHLHIRGLPIDSASSGCSDLKTEIIGDEMRLSTKLKHFTRGVPFDFIVTVPPSVKRVVFGHERVEIWPKDAVGPSYSVSEQQALDIAVQEFKRTKPDLNPDNYYAFVEKPLGPPPEELADFTVIFYQDGPAPSSINEIHRYSVSKSDFKVTYRGKSYSGAMWQLEKLGLLEDDQVPRKSK